ncbi:hypothetical protein L1085_016130 [Streptomyces sp. MSC1_001]|jgi:predicted  nucleic acid-binding Zn-ribbon protein|uniref:hypothetical protein n=1 Tax=Streptomyces sp. MSC1_001 TaxID=2909263 RepID=UPI00202E9F2E|nr:hypothetical protein [Streptomyces sp. MSC1_001]
MPVTRRTYTALQDRYVQALEQRNEARNSLAASRTMCAGYAEENDRLRAALHRSQGSSALAEHARLKGAYAALEQQLLVVQASNEELARELREVREADEKAEAAL